MWLNNDMFTRFMHRLDCADVVWTKQGRKQLWISDEIEFFRIYNLPFNTIKITGIKSCGKIIGFKVKFDNIRVEYYSIYTHSMTAAQNTHFDSFVIANEGSLYMSNIGRRRLI